MGYQYIQPTEEQKEKMQKFRDKYEALHSELTEEFEASRGLSLALTKLEESSFWLNKAITKNDEPRKEKSVESPADPEPSEE